MLNCLIISFKFVRSFCALKYSFGFLVPLQGITNYYIVLRIGDKLDQRSRTSGAQGHDF